MTRPITWPGPTTYTISRQSPFPRALPSGCRVGSSMARYIGSLQAMSQSLGLSTSPANAVTHAVAPYCAFPPNQERAATQADWVAVWLRANLRHPVMVQGGAAPSTPGNDDGSWGNGGSYASSSYLIPLVGGSGGGGGNSPASGSQGGGGGAGGGAILIASTTQITISTGGGISASGGALDPTGAGGAGGSGGAIRLVSNKIANSGSIDVRGGASGTTHALGGAGLARLEAYTLALGTILAGVYKI